MAKYFGYDGYFLNEEEGNLQDSRFRPFMSYLTSKGLYTQWYTNTPGTWSSSKASLLDHGRIMNSVFLNYNWPGTQARSRRPRLKDTIHTSSCFSVSRRIRRGATASIGR